jgi:O-antigen/teichoic acid export membrane protein
MVEAPTAETAGGARRLRLRQGALITVVSALVLLIAMFATRWYGVDEIPGRVATRRQVTHAANAWNELTIVRWLMLATIVVAVGSVLLHGSQRSHGSKTNTGALVAVLGSITAAVLIYRVLIDLPSAGSVVDQKLGAIIGLVAAIGIAFGGYESMLEERARARRAAHASRAPRQTPSGEPER